jgi:hypothetical protein
MLTFVAPRSTDQIRHYVMWLIEVECVLRLVQRARMGENGWSLLQGVRIWVLGVIELNEGWLAVRNYEKWRSLRLVAVLGNSRNNRFKVWPMGKNRRPLIASSNKLDSEPNRPFCLSQVRQPFLKPINHSYSAHTTPIEPFASPRDFR